MCSASVAQLYEKIVEAYGNDYEVATEFTITTDGTNDKYDLPTDFFKLLGVDLQLSAVSNDGTGRVSLKRFNFADRNRYTLPNIQTLWGRTNLRYRPYGNKIWFTPFPQASQTLYLLYVPRFTPFTTTASVFDPINNWQEWAINDLAMKARVKEESPIDDLMRLQAVQEDRLSSIIENRDAGAPQTTVDVYRSNGFGGDGFQGGDWEP